MILRDYVQFEADFPPEPINEEESVIAPIGGEAIMKIFAERLTAQGFEFRNPAIYEDYGWDFTATKGKTSVWCLLQYSEPWLLITKRRGGLFSSLFGKADDPIHAEVVRAIHEVLTTHAKFREPRWYARKDFESRVQSAATPI